MIYATLLLASVLSAYEAKFEVNLGEHANAVYHVACLSGEITCTRAAFEELWNRLGRNEVDAARLKEWEEVLRMQRDAAPKGGSSPYPGNTAGMHPSIRARHNVIGALLNARSPRDLARRATLDRPSATRLWNVVRHFRTRLHGEWRNARKGRAADVLPRMSEQLRNPKLIRLLSDAARFLEPRGPAEQIQVHLIPSPAPEKDAATGTVVGPHVLIEVTNEATAEFAASVALHEGVHYLYDMVPPEEHRRRMQLFVDQKLPRGAAFFALLNEAIAVASQRVLTRRLGMPGEAKSDRETYRHAYIPRAGRVLAPVLSDWLDRAQPFNSEFVAAYAREFTRELGPDLNNPRLVFGSAAYAPTDSAAKAFEMLLPEIQPVSWVKGPRLDDYSELPLVFLGTHEELKFLHESIPELKGLLSKRGYVFAGGGPARRTVAVIGGRDSDAVHEAAKAFLQIVSWPGNGVALTLDRDY